MKRTTTYVLAGIIVLLSVVLVGVLVFVKNQPPQQRAFPTLVNISLMEPDSSKWGLNFPNEYSTLLKTQTDNVDTTYGGSSQFSWLKRDPRQVILFAGYPFSKDYNDDRGHMNSLIDVRKTGRLILDPNNPKHTTATCYSCKSSNNPALWAQMGMAAFDKTLFADMTPRITEPIGCANCHEAGTMRLIVTNPALNEALLSEGKDWRSFTRQEMRTVVCANCHVEYYFKGDGKYLTFPWANGTDIDSIITYYNTIAFKDWDYPVTGTPMLKAQHPDYETYTANSTHYLAGAACADCHMPYLHDGAAKFSSHDAKSPLLMSEQACGQCHTDTEYAVARVKVIQDQHAAAKITTEDALIDAINAIKLAAGNANADATLLDQARQLHRKAQFMWDFVSAENSMGFHNPQYSMRLLADSMNFARQAQMLAAQSVNDPSLLQTETYYSTAAQ
jgi:nitrite reductase (cytochrome c-552)